MDCPRTPRKLREGAFTREDVEEYSVALLVEEDNELRELALKELTQMGISSGNLKKRLQIVQIFTKLLNRLVDSERELLERAREKLMHVPSPEGGNDGASSVSLNSVSELIGRDMEEEADAIEIEKTRTTILKGLREILSNEVDISLKSVILSNILEEMEYVEEENSKLWYEMESVVEELASGANREEMATELLNLSKGSRKDHCKKVAVRLLAELISGSLLDEDQFRIDKAVMDSLLYSAENENNVVSSLADRGLGYGVLIFLQSQQKYKYSPQKETAVGSEEHARRNDIIRGQNSVIEEVIESLVQRLAVRDVDSDSNTNSAVYLISESCAVELRNLFSYLPAYQQVSILDRIISVLGNDSTLFVSNPFVRDLVLNIFSNYEIEDTREKNVIENLDLIRKFVKSPRRFRADNSDRCVVL